MPNIKVAVTYSPEVGGVSVLSLRKAFSTVNFDVIDVDYRAIMRDILKEEFDAAYMTLEDRGKLFAHAKYMANHILNEVSCLALSGNSSMIDPFLFNKPRDENDSYDFSRTIAELALIHVATQKGMPIMGVCGGHQALAVYHGSTVRQLSKHELEKQGYRSYGDIILNIQSILGQLLKPQGKLSLSNSPTLEKNFYGAHMQVVDKLGEHPHLIITAWASDGKSIEAIEREYGAPAIGTQFHPEVTVHGLPPDAAHIGSQEEIKESLKIFRFFYQAAQTFNINKAFQNHLEKAVLKVIRNNQLAKEHESNPNLLNKGIQNNTLPVFANNKDGTGSTQAIDIPAKIIRNNPAKFWKAINVQPAEEVETMDYDDNKLDSMIQ